MRNINYSYDLYLPVITSFQDVEAIMVYSRFGQPFTNKEIEEYETLAKQIGISLEKIKLYEQSEADRSLNQDILNTVQEGIQLIDKNRVIIQVNEQLCEMLGSNYDNRKNAWSIVGKLELYDGRSNGRRGIFDIRYSRPFILHQVQVKKNPRLLFIV